MADPLLHPLLQAVRRVLWRARLLLALRRAAWVAVAACLGAAGWHLGAAALPVWALVAAIVVPLLAALGWTASQRPDDALCARHADRHLGGASAYATWLEQGPAATRPALAHLRQWVAARVPASLQALAEQRPPAVPARPFAALLVCAALAGFVITRSPAEGAAAPAPVASARGPVAAVPPPAAPAPDLAGELARALRAEREPEAPRRGAATAASAGRSAEAGEPPAAAATAPAGAGRAPTAPAPAGADGPSSAAATPPAGGVMAAAAATGREAGESRDERGPGRSTAAPPGALPRQRAPAAPLRGSETMADLGRSGRYDGAEAPPGAAAPRAVPAFAPAMPPSATDSPLLTPAQARYVQAWRQASR